MQAIEFEVPGLSHLLQYWLRVCVRSFAELVASNQASEASEGSGRDPGRVCGREGLLRLPPPVLCRILEADDLDLPDTGHGEDTVLALLCEYVACHSGGGGREGGRALTLMPIYPAGWGLINTEGEGGGTYTSLESPEVTRELWLTCRMRFLSTAALRRLGPRQMSRYSIPPWALVQGLVCRMMDAEGYEDAGSYLYLAAEGAGYEEAKAMAKARKAAATGGDGSGGGPHAAEEADAHRHIAGTDAARDVGYCYCRKALQPRHCQRETAAAMAGETLRAQLSAAQHSVTSLEENLRLVQARAQEAALLVAQEVRARQAVERDGAVQERARVVAEQRLAMAQARAALDREIVRGCVAGMVASVAESGAAEAVASLLLNSHFVPPAVLQPSSQEPTATEAQEDVGHHIRLSTLTVPQDQDHLGAPPSPADVDAGADMYGPYIAGGGWAAERDALVLRAQTAEVCLSPPSITPP